MPVTNRAAELSANLGFAAAVAEFGMLLRKSEHAAGDVRDAAALAARRFRGDDPDGYRAEFVEAGRIGGRVDSRDHDEREKEENAIRGSRFAGSPWTSSNCESRTANCELQRTANCEQESLF